MEKGSDASLKDNDGYTPLDLSFINNHPLSIQLLDPENKYIEVFISLMINKIIIIIIRIKGGAKNDKRRKICKRL